MGKHGRVLTLVLCAAVVVSAPLAWAAGAAIYSCVDGNGKKLTSDRPIVECATRDQRLLNPDGSVKKVVPPTMTHDERAEHEARQREEAAERSARLDAMRHDRNLMARFPNEAAHKKARAAALNDVRKAVQLSERRLAELAVERKPMVDETEFYAGRRLPAALQQQIEVNEGAVEAQRSLIANQQAEEVRINANFDAELAHLKRLWAGMPPGSTGLLRPAESASAARRTASNPASSSTAR